MSRTKRKLVNTEELYLGDAFKDSTYNSSMVPLSTNHHGEKPSSNNPVPCCTHPSTNCRAWILRYKKARSTHQSLTRKLKLEKQVVTSTMQDIAEAVHILEQELKTGTHVTGVFTVLQALKGIIHRRGVRSVITTHVP